tara:strand:+ start:8314 stop:8559 length:246 start_codon:yes stop_codon:yes gene_type:complete
MGTPYPYHPQKQGFIAIMEIEKVSYAVNWKNFRKGYSFFIPCLKCKKAEKVIAEKTGRLKMEVLTKVVVEDGVRGIRVWRL